MSQNGDTYKAPPRTYVSTKVYSAPEQYLKTDEQDEDWVKVSIDEEAKRAATRPSRENQMDVKVGWGERKVTVYSRCWKSQGCGKCDAEECREWARRQEREK
jgi:hypothetical protein